MMVDTLIVGSGVVAAAISQRLLEKNPSASILILEAGDRIKTKDFALWDQYMITRKGVYPFRPFPFTLQDQPLIDAFQKLGYAYGNLPIARRGVSGVASRHAPCQTTGTCKYCPFGARYVASDYIDDIREWNNYPGFDIKLGCIVESITADKRRASGVVYTDKRSGQRVSVEAKTIIVAGGTIESAKLLQRSISADWPKGIGNDHDVVGAYFITHPYFIFTGSMPNTLNLQPEMNFPTLVSRHFDSEAEQKKGKFVLVNPPDTVPVALAARMQAGFSRPEIDSYLTGRLPLQLHGMVEVFGRQENRIENLPRRNRVGLPQTSVKFSADKDFMQRMSEIKAEVQKIYTAMGADLKDDASVSWRADHAACTCRMSPDPSTGVVNGDLQVHGMENLFVCSNAVFPNLGAINPTLTLTALALRLAEFLGGAK